MRITKKDKFMNCISEITHYVKKYHFIDDVRCLRPLIEAVRNPHLYNQDDIENQHFEDELRSKLKAMFMQAGWEGDGEIGCMFIAPCFLGSDDGYCDIVYHVKQFNNGTSWLAIPFDLRLSLPG